MFVWSRCLGIADEPDPLLQPHILPPADPNSSLAGPGSDIHPRRCSDRTVIHRTLNHKAVRKGMDDSMNFKFLHKLDDDAYTTLGYLATACEAEASNPDNPIEDRFELRDRAVIYRSQRRSPDLSQPHNNHQ